MKIGFHLNNKGLDSIDYRNLSAGNPGIGGAEYAITSVASLLSVRNNGLAIVLYVQQEDLFPEGLQVVHINNLESAVERAIEQDVDVLVVDYKYLDDDVVLRYNGRINFIVWCHNFVSKQKYEFYANQSNILRIVHVGKKQHEQFWHRMAFCKSEYIYNGLSMHSIDKYKSDLIPFYQRENNVVYVGSLQEVKGFHYLAKAWKEVLKSVSDANLYVIGSGRLYDRTAKMGKYNIAEATYENRFIPYLTDEKGQTLPSVHFMGIMGEEKNELLLKCKVGVPNPAGTSETFGYSAIEMQGMGCLITSICCPGFKDTVSKTGILFKSHEKLPNSIVALLNRKDNKYNQTYQFIKKNFSYEVVMPQWEKLFYNCANGDKTHLHPDLKIFLNKLYNYSFVKKTVRFILKLK